MILLVFVILILGSAACAGFCQILFNSSGSIHDNRK
jgi:hypothetical protein